MNFVAKLVVAVALTSACSKSPEKQVDAKQLVANGAVLIDVRTPEEFAGGHVPNATNIPIQDFATRIAEVDKLVAGNRGKDIVVYCAAGKRSAKAKTQLEAAGYTRVVNGGGYDDLR